MSATLLTVLFQSFFFFFKNLQVFRSWSEDVHVVWTNSLHLFTKSFFGISDARVGSLFYLDLFETCRCFFILSESLQTVENYLKHYFFIFFSTCELSHLALQFYFYLYSGCSIRTALANFVESDFGCTSRIYFDNVMLMLHSVTLTPHK